MNNQQLELELERMGLLVRRLEHWAQAQPGAVFFYYGEEDESLSYGDFNRMANQIAHNLASVGVRKGDRVSLFLKNPLVITLSMFAIWKLGAVFCPINFLYKGRQLSYQINDTEPKLVITESGRETVFNQIVRELACRSLVVYRPEKGRHDFDPDNAGLELDPLFECSDFAGLLQGPDHDPGTPLDYWDTANIIYTSGTTGLPKGVVQSQRWIQNHCFYGHKMLHGEDVVYCDLPLYHIGGLFALLGRAAYQGCRVAVWDRFSASNFWERIHKSGASYALLLDVMMPWLLKHPEDKRDPHNTLQRVHMQPFPQYHHAFAKRFGIDLVNVAYGSTEIGYACAALVDEAAQGSTLPDGLRKGYGREELLQIAGQLGLPVIPGHLPAPKGFMGRAGVLHQVAILGEHDEELGPNQYGQVCMRGRAPFVLCNEYFKKPRETLDAWRNLWFHTGDGGYRDEDGLLYYVDRMGGFIRVKGENLSSFQVEDFLNRHPQVAMSAVFPVPAEEGLEDDIVAYLVPVAGQEPSEEEIKAWASREMPAYMRPKHLRFVEALPQTPTHKVEKYKLKEMFLDSRA